METLGWPRGPIWLFPKGGLPCSPVDLAALWLPPHSSVEGQQWHLMYPVPAPNVYVDLTSTFRRWDQLFMPWVKSSKGIPINKQWVSHRTVDAILLAYSRSGLQVPAGFEAHSTKGLVISWAKFRTVSIHYICTAANWSFPFTFARSEMSHAVPSTDSPMDPEEADSSKLAFLVKHLTYAL